MVVVILGIVDFRIVALRAYAVTGCSQRRTMWFVAVRANNTGLVHLALYKGSIDVDLVKDLPIRMIQRLAQQTASVQNPEMQPSSAEQGAPIGCGVGLTVGVGSTTPVQVPSEPGRLQNSFSASQARSQQNPSAQKPESHWVGCSQEVP